MKSKNSKTKILIFFGNTWLPMDIEFEKNWFGLSWSGDHDFYIHHFRGWFDSDKEEDKYWLDLYSTYPELEEIEDGVVYMPYSRLPSFKKSKIQ